MSVEQLAGEETRWSWPGDVYDRGVYAQFLTNYLIGKTQDGDKLTPYCMALDAEWGAGKTFFVDRWNQQLQQENKYISFKFNAWEADFQTDPILAFISEFKSAMDARLLEMAPSSAVEHAKETLSNGINKISKLATPIAVSMLKGAASKFLPGLIEGIAEAIKHGNIDSLDCESIFDSATKGAIDGASTYIKKALAEQAERKQLLEEFRVEIADFLVKIRGADANISLPVFIFVDEIDRCRPSFAVELLEGLKHIFNIPGLCFVVSTNIKQLSHAVTAIYGNGFDGSNYLHRFFDSTYSIKKPTSKNYIKYLCKKTNSIHASLVVTAIPGNTFTNSNRESIIVDIIHAVADAFKLDLRSQEKYYEIIDSAASAMNGKKIHLWWLAILAAAKISNRGLFDLLSNPASRRILISEEFESKLIDKRNLSYNTYTAGTTEEIFIKIVDMANLYHELSSKTNAEVLDLLNRMDSISVERLAYQEVFDRGPYYDSLAVTSTYPDIVECAGHFQTQ